MGSEVVPAILAYSNKIPGVMKQEQYLAPEDLYIGYLIHKTDTPVAEFPSVYYETLDDRNKDSFCSSEDLDRGETWNILHHLNDVEMVELWWMHLRQELAECPCRPNVEES